jgi:hypothetical protein
LVSPFIGGGCVVDVLLYVIEETDAMLHYGIDRKETIFNSFGWAIGPKWIVVADVIGGCAVAVDVYVEAYE